MDTPLLKCCSKCIQSKPLDAFHRNHHAQDGRRSKCIACYPASKARGIILPVKLSSAEKEAFKALALESGISVSELVRQLVVKERERLGL